VEWYSNDLTSNVAAERKGIRIVQSSSTSHPHFRRTRRRDIGAKTPTFREQRLATKGEEFTVHRARCSADEDH
jgi:hypothetical protein